MLYLEQLINVIRLFYWLGKFHFNKSKSLFTEFILSLFLLSGGGMKPGRTKNASGWPAIGSIHTCDLLGEHFLVQQIAKNGNPLLNFSLYATVDQLASMNVPTWYSTTHYLVHPIVHA